MKTKITVILLLILAAQFVYGQGMTKNWEKVAGASYSWFSTTSNNTNSCAYNPVTGHLLVANRGDKVYIVDVADGTQLGSLDLTGITPTTYSFAKVRVTTDGVIYAATMITAAGVETIYRWSSESDVNPTTITYTTLASRVGDAFAVSGTGASTVLYLSGTGATLIDVLTTTDGSGFTLNKSITVTASWARGGLDAVTTGTSSDLWVKGAGLVARRINSSGTSQFATTSGSNNGQLLSNYNNLKYYTFGTKKIIASNGSTSVLGTAGLLTRFLDVTSETTPITLSEVTLAGSGSNGAISSNSNATGDIAFKDVSSSSFVAYVLLTNNTLASYTYSPSAPSTPVATAASDLAPLSFYANWSAANNAFDYELDVSTEESFATFVTGYQSVAVGPVTTYKVTVPSPAASTYYYRVRARNTEGTTGNSNIISTGLRTTFSGTYTLGAGGNYTSLKAACDALNAGTISSSVTMSITSNLLETSNSGLAVNPASGVYVTFKPAPGVQPTITFGQSADNTGASGAWVIGSPDLTVTSASNYGLITTNRIIIDGSNSEGGTTRDLSLVIPSTSSSNTHGIRTMGDVNECTFKNLNVTLNQTTGSSLYGIVLTVYNNTGFTNKVPDNITIENNNVSALTGNAMQGIAISNSGTPTAYPTGIIIRKNNISARTRGIFLNYAGNTVINNNTIQINQTNTGSMSFGIYGYLIGASTSTIEIYNNTISQLATTNTQSTFGIRGIECASRGVYTVYNNTITGFSGPSTVTATEYTGIKVTGSSSGNTLSASVYFNTVYMNNVSTAANSSVVYTGIYFVGGAGTNSATFKNNIVVSGEDDLTNYLIYRSGSLSTFTSDKNCFYRTGTTNTKTGYFNTSAYAALSDWRTASSQDANSIETDPLLVSTTNLAIGDDYSPAINAGVQITSPAITTDILGNSRSNPPDIGAYEFQAGTAPSVPTGLSSSSVTEIGFTANWQAVSGAIRYRLDVATDAAFTSYVTGYQNLNVGNVTTYAITGLTTNTTYYFRVKSSNGNTSAPSTYASVTTLNVPPSVPAIGTPTNISNFSFTANWSAASGATAYHLQIASDDAFENLVAGYEDKNVGNVVTYNVTGLTDGVEYFYRVRAYNGQYSAYSASQSALCPFLDPPTAPVANEVSTKTISTFVASWSASTGATSYKIDVATDAAFTALVTGYNNYDVGSVTTYTVTGLTESTQYWYRVRGYNQKYSSYSNVITVTTNAKEQFTGDYYVGSAGTGPSGSTPRFATLKDACDALNAGNITGNVNVYICSNTTEASNIGLGVNTNSHTLTFKPYTGVSPVLTFTQTTANQVYGLWLIGTSTLNPTETVVPTSNVVIDGSNTALGTSRNMTISYSGSAASSIYGIRVLGNSDNVVIKNLIVNEGSTSSSNVYGIGYSPYTDVAPDNGIVENCEVTVSGSSAGNGVGVSNFNTLTAGTAANNLIIRNNVINARHRGIFLSYAKNLEISGNTISINQTGGGYLSEGIYWYTTNGVTENTSVIKNNKFQQLQTAATSSGDYGVVGVLISVPGTYSIYNNTFGGYNAASSTTNCVLQGLRVTDATANVDFYHNTIYIPEVSNITTTTGSNLSGVVITSAVGGALNIKNNIVLVKGNLTSYGIYKGGTGGTINSDYNLVYVPGTNGKFGLWNSTSYATQATWNAATGQDAHSRSADVTFASSSNLSLSGNSIGDNFLAGTPLTAVTTDIDGETRSTTYPYIGADEVPASPLELLTFDVTALIQNLTSSSSGTMPASSATITLKSASSPFATVYSRSISLNTNGNGSALMYGARLNTSYYVAVSGGNTLETWSANPVNFNSANVSYDFTSAQNKAYGNNLVQVGSKWCLYNGDVNQDGVIDFTDVKLVDNDAQNLVTGSGLSTDIDGSGAIDYGDTHLLSTNVGNYVQVAKPVATVETLGKPESNIQKVKNND